MRARANRRRIVVVVAVLTSAVLALSACSVEEALPTPWCFRDGSGLIVAQSVSSGELIPCFEDLPTGWRVAGISIDQDHTVVRLDSDRAGAGAAVLRYEESCDIGEAVPVPSEQAGAERFDFIERLEPGFRAQRYYLFDGGCAWWAFDFDDDAPAALSVEVGGGLFLMSRETLNDNIREDFIDEEL